MGGQRKKKCPTSKERMDKKPDKYETLRSRTGRVRTLVIRPLKCVSSLKEAVKGGGGKGPKVPMAIKPEEGGGG